ncbi:MAG TPA: antibiotic biosynthesis monooxygenase [Candidatus Dormibacteraeota bacterium]|nr:antibiotic biosynthesis monooxygenase [Candidatus Dormibacteraeota bacterium]
MIARLWRGWATRANADSYVDHYLTSVLEHLRQVDGFIDAELLRRDDGEDVELVSITYFESLDAIRTFAGADWEAAVVAPEAQRLLLRFDERCSHYAVSVTASAADRQR